MERYYTWADYLKGKKYLWVPLNVGKILGLKKVKRMAAPKIFCECGNVSKGFAYIKITFRYNDAV